MCLLILIAQLALGVAHSWEMPVDAVALSVTRAFHAVPKGTEGATALAKAATVSRRGQHDPLLCQVCQILSQVKYGITLHGSAVVPLHHSLACLPGAAFSRFSLALAASAPRAPPSLP